MRNSIMPTVRLQNKR